MKHWLVYFVLIGLFILGSCTQEKNTIQLEELTIEEIHTAYREGAFTCYELTEAYLNRISLSNDTVNAITIVNPKALEEAKKLDEELKNTNSLKPLHGIPIIVKDNINTSGLPTTAGSLALEFFIPESDAFIIQKLKEAGAIIIAKSNMAEWAFSPMHTESSTHGTTKNPYNLSYVPAGSSGGTAAAVAMNFGTVGLGTDTGNSIRGPSSHCALVGIRPSLGLISRSGIVPLFLRNDVVGPMCRTVADATRLLGVMTGYDPEDSITRFSGSDAGIDFTGSLNKDGLSGSRIGVLRQISASGIDGEVAQSFEDALSDLENGGASVIDSVEITDFEQLIQNQWCATFREDVEAFLEKYVNVDSLSTLEDIIRVGTKSEFAESRLKTNQGFNERWGNVDLDCGDAFTDSLRIAFRQSIETMMDSLRLDAIVFPTWNYKPAILDQFEEQYRGDNNQLISPHTGQPAITVPMGYTSEGLPMGIQFLGRIFDEAKLIELAYSYEQGTNHRRPPN